MGQKVNPIGFRLGVNRNWDSRWYAEGKEYGELLHEDMRIRDYLQKTLKNAGISRIIIERPHKKCRVTIHTARPGVIIGKKGASQAGLDDRLRGASEHRRGAQAGDRCAAGGGQYRPAAGAPRGLPACHEAGRAVGHCLCRHSAPTWTTAPRLPLPPMAPTASRCGSTRARSWNTILPARRSWSVSFRRAAVLPGVPVAAVAVRAEMRAAETRTGQRQV